MKICKFSVFIVLYFTVIFPLLAQVTNAGVGGNSTNNLLERLDKDVLQKQPDLVILMVGTNDMLNSKKMIPYALYENNLNELVQRIKKNGANVLLMSPPPVDSVYLFQRHNRNMFKEIPNVKLDSVRKIISRISKNTNIKYLDLFQVFREMSLPKHNEDLFFKNQKNSGRNDGVHPTALGYRFIGELVFRYLKDENLLTENQKIICFGDSITFGSGVKGKGTATGETYPAILQKLIYLNQKRKE